MTLAEQHGVPVLRPESASDPSFLAAFAAWEAELGLVVSYGQILRRSLLDLPREGFINVHGSLLPRWRGASPVQAAILAGDEQSGVCIQKVVEALDAGDVLASRALALSATERADELFERLSQLGAELLFDFVAELGQQLPAGVAQDESSVTHCRKLRRSDGELEWERSAIEIDRRVRAMYGWPWAQAVLPQGQQVRVLSGEPLDQDHQTAPGTVLATDGGIQVACGAGVFRIDQLQRVGKAVLPAAEFLRGTSIEVGTRFQRFEAEA